jgi:hypothetical protein
MRFKKLAVATGNPTAPWTAIFNTMRGVELYGYSEAVEVDIDVIDNDEPGCYFAWLEASGMLKFVRPSGNEVRAALGPGLTLDPTLGRVVRVRITPTQAEQVVVEEVRGPYAAAVQGVIRLAA